MFDLTTAVGSQTDKLQITTIEISDWEHATGPTVVVTYKEYETDGTTYIRTTRQSLTDRAAIKALFDTALLAADTVYGSLESQLHDELIAEGYHGAGAIV